MYNVKRSCTGMLLLMAFFIAGCASTIDIQYKPLQNPDNLLASVPPVRVKLLQFHDTHEGRKEPVLVGEKQTGVRVGRVELKSAQPVPAIIREAMRAELTRSGHTVVDENEDITIKGDITYFWLKTDVHSEDGHTIDNWDVIAEIRVLLEATNIGTGRSGFFGPYVAKNNEIRNLEPDSRTMKRIFEGALSKLMHLMNTDTQLAGALKK